MKPGFIVITGGAGFLGSWLTKTFRSHGASVRIYDIAEAPDWAHGEGIEYLQGDIRDGAALGRAVEGASAIIHSAFASPRMTPEAIEGVNVEGARQLSSQAVVKRVPRVVLISSSVVTREPRVHPFLPNAGITAFDSYRKSRAEAERIVMEQGGGSFTAALVRPKTFVGPGRISAFTIVFDWIRQGKPVVLMGKGNNRYQLLEIGDMAEGIRLLAGSTAQGVFNFGASRFGTLREDLQALIDHAGTSSQLRSIPAPAARSVLRTMDFCGLMPPSELHYLNAWGKDSVVDTSRAINELGWTPNWSNADALRRAYDWYLESIAATGSARTIHPLPGSHRMMGKLIETILR